MNSEFVTLSDEQLEAVAGASLEINQKNVSLTSQKSIDNSARARASASSEGDQYVGAYKSHVSGSWDRTAVANANAGNIASTSQSNSVDF